MQEYFAFFVDFELLLASCVADWVIEEESENGTVENRYMLKRDIKNTRGKFWFCAKLTTNNKSRVIAY